MDQLSVKAAAQHIGKSESTIKRLLREITSAPDHPDRHLISPTQDVVAQRRAAGEPYVWKIGTELLDRRYPPDQATSNKPASSIDTSSNDRLISVLEKTIAVLEEELNAKNSQLAAFQERQREQHLLLKNLQEQLPMPGASSSSTTTSALTVDEEREQDTRSSIWTRNFHLFGKRKQL